MPTPLHHKTVLITRRREQSAELQTALEHFGAQVIFLPTIQVIPPESWGECDAAVRRLDSYDVIVFASVNAVTFFLHRCVALGVTPDRLARCELAVVGRKTGAELERLKLRPQHIPEEFSVVSLLQYFERIGIEGKRVLLPRGNLSRPELVEGMRRLGAEVDPVTVYCTINADLKDADEVMKRILDRQIDVVTFASPSAVNNFAGAFPASVLSDVFQRTLVAAIGPTTAEAVRGYGVEPSIIAKESTARGLAEAIADYYRRDS